MLLRTVLVGLALAAAPAAMAGTYTWDWHRGDAGSYGISDAGGKWESISASFDTSTNHLTWSTTFSNQITDGFTLALNDGPNPKGHAGELALLYFDARNHGDIKMTAYAYNGQNLLNSFQDGNGNVNGNQAADKIHGTLDSSWIISKSVVDAAGKRTMSFTIDATTINSHVPLYPDINDDWFGMGFGEKLGLWFHTIKGLDASYGADGYLTQFKKGRYGKEGYFDGTNFCTTQVVVPLPAPVALGLAGLGGVAVMIRRRK